MVKIKGWKRLQKTPIELSDGGDSFHGIWEKDGLYLFIVDDNFGGYIIGTKYKSQMSEPEIVARSVTKDKALKKSISYMRRNP